MLVKTFGSAVYGVEAITITIEVNVSAGQNYQIVGLPDNAVRKVYKEQKVLSKPMVSICHVPRL